MARSAGTLTRKDFETIGREAAGLLGAVTATIEEKGVSRAACVNRVSLQWRSFVNALADHLAKTNTQFDKERFLAECERPVVESAAKVVATILPHRD